MSDVPLQVQTVETLFGILQHVGNPSRILFDDEDRPTEVEVHECLLSALQLCLDQRVEVSLELLRDFDSNSIGEASLLGFNLVVPSYGKNALEKIKESVGDTFKDVSVSKEFKKLRG